VRAGGAMLGAIAVRVRDRMQLRVSRVWRTRTSREEWASNCALQTAQGRARSVSVIFF